MESWKTDEKKRDEIKSEERRCNGAKVRRKKIHPRQMLEKSEVAKCYVFRASGESKSRLVKAAGAESCMWSEEKSKIARRCGLKRVFRWTCTKHVSFGPLFEVQMSKNYTPLWREEHVSFGPLFEVPMPKNCTRLWREAHFQVFWRNFWSSDVENLVR